MNLSHINMKKVLVIILIFLVKFSFGQCRNYHQEECSLPYDWEYELNSQAFSTKIMKGQSFKVNLVAYQDNMYYLGFCSSENINLYSFKINIVGNEYTEEDLQESDNIKYIEFNTEITQSIVVVVSLHRSNNDSFSIGDPECFGLIFGDKPIEESY